ncbi:MAG: T9SS type A sorting domain-containing protein [Prolixibacteraceae bacterium]
MRDVTALHFGYSTVNISGSSKHISVLRVKNIDPISTIDGSRRYSFNCDGQLNLFQDCYSNNGRHDFVTGARVCGPNVFTRCTARNPHNDIGPHHRWSCGTLFDVINTTGDINIQDRGDWGTGHGWAGVNQVLWNCIVKGAAVQSPWVSGMNYSIGTIGNKLQGRLSGRPDGYWEGRNKAGLEPESLYEAQLSNSKGYKVYKEELKQGQLKFYPNPCNNELKVNSSNDKIGYQMFSADGIKIQSGILNVGYDHIDTSVLSQGMYILQYESDKCLYQQKIRIVR